MNKSKYLHHPWKIIESGWDPENIKSSESIFSLGNGAMGQRANFEEDYSGDSFQGSYVGGVYYPDKTRVGWWKNGYPEYFAKVLNAPNWIGIHLKINKHLFDLNTAHKIDNYRRELDMKNGVYRRSLVALVQDNIEITIEVTRFLSMRRSSLGAIEYKISSSQAIDLEISSYLDAGITNEDSNWDDQFWEIEQHQFEHNRAYIQAQTLKTAFSVGTFMETRLVGGQKPEQRKAEKKIELGQHLHLEAGKTITLVKLGGYVSSRNHPKEMLFTAAQKILDEVKTLSFSALMKEQSEAWAKVWESADIEIEGDIKAQQAIRFNIFQLNQTYTGEDAALNIGPKGFTGEKYGGSTYWDTEAYCIPFYMATKNQEVARNLLTYRYLQLEKAIENAEKLGFSNRAALFPMVTMNGEECHNEWEITFEEIHRNSAIAFAIYNYTRYTGDVSYIPQMGMEVLIGIARFWAQRVSFSEPKNSYVILGVTGPNEYENNVNNNWYTNYSAAWCLEYAAAQFTELQKREPEQAKRIMQKVSLQTKELGFWTKIAKQMYFPIDPEQKIFLQQEGFLDKEMIPADQLNPEERPINQHWSWDRILRSPYIKQADVLQGLYFFEDHFSEDTIRRNYNFYESLTVHESSLSPCVHAILASKLKKDEQAYSFYLRTSRLDLDDYNSEVEEGLHITSMAGTWMSIVEGFAGMRIKNKQLYFSPRLPVQWEKLSFKINFRNVIYSIALTKNEFKCQVNTSSLVTLQLNEHSISFKASCVASLK